MALNATILGEALFDARQPFVNQTLDTLLTTYETLDGIRLAIATAEAGAIITHITSYGTVPALGLESSDGPVTGVAQIQ